MTICTLCALLPCRRGRLHKPAPDGPVRLRTARRQPSRPCTAHHPGEHQVSACCQLSFSYRSDIHRLSVCQIMVVPSGPSDLNSFADAGVARARGSNLHLPASPAACSWLPVCVPCSRAYLSVWHRVNPPASCSTFTNTQLAWTCTPTHERGPVLTSPHHCLSQQQAQGRSPSLHVACPHLLLCFVQVPRAQLRAHPVLHD